MPQFDKITFFNQIFWFLLSFLAFYFILLKIFIPLLAYALKTRNKLSGFLFIPRNFVKNFTEKKKEISFFERENYSYFESLKSFLPNYFDYIRVIFIKKEKGKCSPFIFR